MATAKIAHLGQALQAIDGSSTSNDEVLVSFDSSKWQVFTAHSTAGVFDIEATLDGTNWFTVALTPQSAVDDTPVLVSVAGEAFGFQGQYQQVRAQQNGGVAVANFALVASSLNS